MSFQPQDIIGSAFRTLETERSGLGQLADALADVSPHGLGCSFTKAAQMLGALRGRVIVTGVGKSGHVGVKIAATLASTGTPAFFVHSAEANHGDLGMIGRDDAVLALSWSGETTELQGIVAYAKRFDIPIVALTSGVESTLANAADFPLILPRAVEACPHGLAPTTSALMQLALGDALAVALLEARGFTAVDFKGFHPGGQLGASLTPIEQIMHKAPKLPLLELGANMQAAVLEMTEKGFGCVAIAGKDGALRGIITDGDLRRHMTADLLGLSVDEVMTPDPKTAKPDMLAVEVLQLLNARKISAMLVVDDAKMPIGIVHLHDLLRIGVA